MEKISKDERVYDGYLKVDGASFKDEKGEYKRYKLTRPNAACALLVDAKKSEVILVKQHRYPIEDKANGNILEIVAGKVDEGETPLEAIKREILEEVGYDVPMRAIEEGDYIEFFPSPGYTDEKVYAFLVYVDEDMKVSEGGGLESEREGIEIVRIPMIDFAEKVRTNKIVDAKTIIAFKMFYS
jgi:nudix-type nucleoside diphosphatase (YffH/AdpP family)